MSVGWNPTFKDLKYKTIEPWILHDFEEDFYGCLHCQLPSKCMLPPLQLWISALQLWISALQLCNCALSPVGWF